MSRSELTRRGFLGMSGAAALTGMLAGGGAGEQSASSSEASPASNLKKRPNLILFVPDEMRADSLACFGNPVTKTPNYDRLASEGTKFPNCHVQYPMCVGSRCSFLTGWPASVRGHRSFYYFLRPEEPNLFRYLKEGGYDVYWYGKNDALAAQCFHDSTTIWAEGGAPVPGLNFGGPPYTFLEPASGERRKTIDYQRIQSAIKVLERKENDKPFCIFLAMIQPHPPYTCPADFYNMYSPSEIPPLIPRGLPRRPSYHKGMLEMYGLANVPESTFRKIRAVYYGQVSYVDWLLGVLLEAMERTNHTKDTALFCFSDHGDYTGDYGLVEKWTSGLEDVLTHVPMVARVPGGAQGVVAEDMVELFDIMATCLDLAGIQARHTHFSRSMLPQIAGQRGDPNRAAFCEGGYDVYEPQCYEPMDITGVYSGKVRLQNLEPQTITRCAMVRTKEAKAIVRPNGQSELYVYGSDPHEENNVYGERSVATLQSELEQRLLHWYINTSGIAPFDKDWRDLPPYYPNRENPQPGWQEALLDK